MNEIKNLLQFYQNKYNKNSQIKRYCLKDHLIIFIERTSYLKSDCHFAERVYHIENDLFKIPLCPICNNGELTFKRTEYTKTCSSKCWANSQEKINKTKQTLLERYGVDHNMKLEKCKESRKQTYINNYGVDNPSKCETIKIKKEETCLNNYGVKSGLQTQQCKDGFMNKYGVTNANYVPEIHEKQQKYRWKDFTMPSNKIVKIQGYENFALDKLLELYTENEIILSRKDIPEIWYFNPEDNKQHRYYPDIYIPKDNLIIEVKSQWTYDKYLTINKLKEQATISNGYKYQLLIF